MKNKINPLKQLIVAFLAGLLASGSYNSAFAAFGNSTSQGAKIGTPALKRVQDMQQGFPVPLSQKGVKTFEVFGSATAQLVVDESTTAPTVGLLTGIEISSTPASGVQCWALAFDASTTTIASSLNEGTTAAAIVPPFFSTATASNYREYLYPKQFNKGLWVYVSAAACRVTVQWARNGGSD